MVTCRHFGRWNGHDFDLVEQPCRSCIVEASWQGNQKWISTPIKIKGKIVVPTSEMADMEVLPEQYINTRKNLELRMKNVIPNEFSH